MKHVAGRASTSLRTGSPPKSEIPVRGLQNLRCALVNFDERASVICASKVQEGLGHKLGAAMPTTLENKELTIDNRRNKTMIEQKQKLTAKSKKKTVLDDLASLGFKPSEARSMLPVIFLYLFKGCDQAHVKMVAAKVNPLVNLFPFLSKIPWMGELTLHDKVTLFALFKGEDPGIKPNAYLKGVLEDKALLAHLRTLKDHPSYTVYEVSALERRAIINTEITTYMGKFIYRKMSFITKNYGVTAEDIVEQLQERAIHNLRVNYPNWNAYGDMLAMAKSAIANAGHNLINYYAATKRAKVSVANTAVEVSLDLMQELAGDSYEYTALIYSEFLDRGMASIETAMSVNSILKKAGSKPIVQHFIRLLAGHPDDGFTDYLGRCNSEFAEEEPFEKVLVKTCTYLGVDRRKAERVLASFAC